MSLFIKNKIIGTKHNRANELEEPLSKENRKEITPPLNFEKIKN